MLLEIILKNLQREGILTDGRQVGLLVAYSGGIDSTVLLHLLADLRAKHNVSLTAAHVDHGWRGTPPEELPLVHQTCLELNVPLVLIQPDRSLPRTETAAREVRYRELTRLAEDIKADAVLTAHHADDQVETLLFRLFRGTGTDGLVGIQKRLVLHPPDGRPVPILRPMLDIYREGIRRYAQDRQLKHFEDPTNQDLHHTRNAIRQEILPFLQQRFPQAKSALLRLTDVVEGDVSILSDKMEPIWSQVYRPASGNRPSALDTILFNQLGTAYQRRIVKRFLLAHHLEVDFHKIDEIMDFIQGIRRKNLGASLMSLENAPAGGEKRFLSLYKNRITIVTVKPRPTGSGEAETHTLPLPGEVQVPTLNLTLEAVALTEEECAAFKKRELSRPHHSKELAVDLSKFEGKTLEIRTRRPGDKIQPFGMAFPMRFKNFLINRGVPRFERDKLPVLASGQEVLWAVGVGMSENLRVTEKPTHLLKAHFTS